VTRVPRLTQRTTRPLILPAATATAAIPRRPPFAANVTAGKPANHIPTSAPCIQCHTAGNYAQYSSPGTHQGVTECLELSRSGGRGEIQHHQSRVLDTLDPRQSHSADQPGRRTAAARAATRRRNVTPGGAGFRIGHAEYLQPDAERRRTIAPSSSIACATCHDERALHGHDGQHVIRRGGFASTD